MLYIQICLVLGWRFFIFFFICIECVLECGSSLAYYKSAVYSCLCAQVILMTAPWIYFYPIRCHFFFLHMQRKQYKTYHTAVVLVLAHTSGFEIWANKSATFESFSILFNLCVTHFLYMRIERIESVLAQKLMVYTWWSTIMHWTFDVMTAYVRNISVEYCL